MANITNDNYKSISDTINLQFRRNDNFNWKATDRTKWRIIEHTITSMMIDMAGELTDLDINFDASAFCEACRLETKTERYDNVSHVKRGH